ncbi:hypothetical protein [Methylocella sp.]|jgi:hypothetical protein|uniref:hypothetical protein n=1 Tax=Methylocella sp. TaxID=1978226 RepID=UPI003C23EB01
MLLPLSFATAARAACVPNENQAAFYIDAGYNGGCVVKDLGSYANAGEIGLPNDSISSLRLGRNVQVVLCKDDDFKGDCILLDAGESFLNNNRVGNDQVSSLRVEPLGAKECPPQQGQASFYVNAEFVGPCVIKPIGDYANSDAIGLPNDSISSVRVGPGVEAVLCKDNDFNGGCIVVTQDNGFINTKTVGNDQTSSVKVQHAGAGQ